MTALSGPSAAAGGAGWEALFWLVFNRSSNPIVLLDEQQRVLEINEPGVALIGRPRGELLGGSLIDSFAAADRSAAARTWATLLQTREGVGTRVLVRPDGSATQVDWAGRLASIGGRRVVIAVMIGGTPVREPGGGSPPSALTRREREVVTLISLGHETGEIAAILVVSPETVKSHVRKAMSKLEAHTRAQLVAVALATGQIEAVPQLSA
jgi:PAS domain S-box-containing protein